MFDTSYQITPNFMYVEFGFAPTPNDLYDIWLLKLIKATFLKNQHRKP